MLARCQLVALQLLAEPGGFVDQRLEQIDAEHLERAGHPVQQGDKRFERGAVVVFKIGGQQILGLADFRAQRLTQRLHGLRRRHTEPGFPAGARDQGIECKRAPDLGSVAGGGMRLPDLVQHGLDERFATVAQQAAVTADCDLLELLFETRQQFLAIVVNRDRAGGQCIQVAARNPELLLHERQRRLILQTLDQRGEVFKMTEVAGIPQPVE